MNIANWDITNARLDTLRILAQITLLIPTGEILNLKKIIVIFKQSMKKVLVSGTPNFSFWNDIGKIALCLLIPPREKMSKNKWPYVNRLEGFVD